MNRNQIEKMRYAALKNAAPEMRNQAKNDWLRIATPAEVRRGWQKWMGNIPAWARND